MLLLIKGHFMHMVLSVLFIGIKWGKYLRHVF